MNIIGLDLSTAVIGYAVIDDTGHLITFGRIKLPREHTLAFAYTALKTVLEQHAVNYAVVEDAFLGPNAKTFKELAKLRGITELLLDVMEIKFSAIMPSSARSRVFQNGKLSKEQCFNLLVARYPNASLYDKGYNISDALVIALSKIV